MGRKHTRYAARKSPPSVAVARSSKAVGRVACAENFSEHLLASLNSGIRGAEDCRHHSTWRIGSFRKNQPVTVVGHQDTGVYPASGLARVLAQPIAIKTVIFIRVKARLSVFTATDDVRRDVW
nr:hypothetical protein [Acidihalobacter ferrooxydans]